SEKRFQPLVRATDTDVSEVVGSGAVRVAPGVPLEEVAVPAGAAALAEADVPAEPPLRFTEAESEDVPVGLSTFSRTGPGTLSGRAGGGTSGCGATGMLDLTTVPVYWFDVVSLAG